MSIIGTRWIENDKRFVRIVEVVSEGERIGRKTLSNNGLKERYPRVTSGDAAEFFKRFRPLETKDDGAAS